MGGERKRPVYWGPEFVLCELGEGRNYTDIVKQAAADVGLTDYSYNSWYQDIRTWKREVDDFEERYNEVVQGGGSNGRNVEFDERAKTELLELMTRNGGDAVEAAYDLGFTPGTVFSRLNPKSPRFDEEFARAYYDAESEHLAKAAQAYAHAAVERDEEGDLKYPNLLWRFNESRSPHLFSQKRHLQIEGEIEHRHKVIPASVTRQLAATAQALREPEVVDVDVEES